MPPDRGGGISVLRLRHGIDDGVNGAGDTRTHTLINLACLWFLEIPLAWVLAYPAGLGPTGVFIAVSVGFSTLAVVSAWLFSKGTWKTQRV